jgi:hypothetical protein
MKQYDAILHIVPQENVNESERIFAQPGTGPGGISGFNRHFDADDPKMYHYLNFGNVLRQNLANWGNGFSAKITDFKKWVVVDVNYHNHITGKTASKTFLIIFKEKGTGLVLSTHNKYRTISGVDQATSYIKSACNSLQNDTNQNRIG